MRAFPLPPLARRHTSDRPAYVACLTDTQTASASTTGLIVCSAEGRVRYWERLTLSGADEFVDMAASLDLRPDHGGVALINCEVRSICRV